jgi:hypothetical protein
VIRIACVRDPEAVVDYCSTNIGPQRYYLHTAVGGQGWRVYRTRMDPTWSIDLADELEAQAVIIALKYSE